MRLLPRRRPGARAKVGHARRLVEASLKDTNGDVLVSAIVERGPQDA